MQPKAAKKIGGMTPKKMTGGEDTKEFDFDGTIYSIKKKQKDDKLEICVSAAMPTGSMVEPPAAADKDKPQLYIKPDPAEAAAIAEAAADGSERGPAAGAEGAAIAEAAADGSERRPAADGSERRPAADGSERRPAAGAEGGKKKRKSSKKRKSMKKKGGMKRKSMKVKA